MKFTDYKKTDIGSCKVGDLEPVFQHMDSSAPEIWVSMSEVIYITLRENPEFSKISDNALGLCATKLVYQLATDFGGQAFYLPKGVRPMVEAKNSAIVAEFTGHNSKELARKHGVTEMRVRQILAAHRAKGLNTAHQN